MELEVEVPPVGGVQAAPRAMPTAPRSLTFAIIWFALAGVGLVGTWWFNIAFFGSGPEFGYLEGWFANAASSSAAVDIIVVAVAASVFMLVEGARLGWARWAWVLVVLSFAVAVAFTFPLFLGLRELALRRRAAR
ncbi:DUF2834 domain-containing protein [Agrococcus sp. ARC_14]|uniref:DUF2834 domain-containing protein n=1 Tax=Agrococcus sp. ARC_14 TaxID=2919927 RepID=UPI001F059CF5|nr:DUF2834 domain-containing protein [Agrococcus sp. ARC_14]MCH1881875.1 DUF2834 domain-containing protein [Agrococcus sp. ARC_14]